MELKLFINIVKYLNLVVVKALNLKRGYQLNYNNQRDSESRPSPSQETFSVTASEVIMHPQVMYTRHPPIGKHPPGPEETH